MVVLLQFSGRHVQLLVDFSVLVIDLPEEVHLLRQVLNRGNYDCFSCCKHKMQLEELNETFD